MVATESYHDLCAEIDILELRLEDLEREYYFLYHACFNGKRKPVMRLDMIIKRMNEICDQVEYYNTVLQGKEDTQREIEKRISELESIDYQVTYRRDIKGMTISEIASDLGYSEIWIKKISARNPKRLYQEYTNM